MVRFYTIFALLMIAITGCGQKNGQSHTEAGGDLNSAEEKAKTATNSTEGESVTVSQAFMYTPVPGSQVGAIYLVLENHTASPLILNYIHTPLADRVEVHQHLHEDGMMKMREVKHLKIAPKGKQLFEPGGYHLMIFDFFDSVEEGDQFKLSIEFEGGHRAEALVDVRAQG